MAVYHVLSEFLPSSFSFGSTDVIYSSPFSLQPFPIDSIAGKRRNSDKSLLPAGSKSIDCGSS